MRVHILHVIAWTSPKLVDLLARRMMLGASLRLRGAKLVADLQQISIDVGDVRQPGRDRVLHLPVAAP